MTPFEFIHYDNEDNRRTEALELFYQILVLHENDRVVLSMARTIVPSIRSDMTPPRIIWKIRHIDKGFLFRVEPDESRKTEHS